MKNKAILALALLAALSVAPAAFAQESEIVVIPETIEITASTDIALDPIAQMNADLAELKAKESSPETGAIAKFFLRIKIREIENRLNITAAIQ